MSNGKKWAVVFSVFMAAGLALVIYLELSGTKMARGPAPGPGPNLSQVIPVRNPAKELALKFYRAHNLWQDAEAAWDMMAPEMQTKVSRLGKEYYLASFKYVKPHSEPRGGIQVDEFPPDDDFYTFLVRAAGEDPTVIVVRGSGDTFKVFDDRYWKGEKLP